MRKNVNFDCFFTTFVDFWFKHFNFDFFKAPFDIKVATRARGLSLDPRSSG